MTNQLSAAWSFPVSTDDLHVILDALEALENSGVAYWHNYDHTDGTDPKTQGESYRAIVEQIRDNAEAALRRMA